MRAYLQTIFAGLMIGIGFFAADAGADIFMKQQHHTDGFQMMGRNQPPRDFVQKIWMTADKARSDAEGHSIIVRLDKGVSYLLDHTRKAFTELPMGAGQSGSSRTEGRMSKEQRGAMDRMAESMKNTTIRISDTGETKKIGEYRCRKYLQQIDSVMGPVTSEIWATQDLKMDTDLYARFSFALMASQPGGREAMNANIAEIKKIRGVPVQSLSTTRMRDTEMKTRVDLVEYREEPAPADLFDIPPGYSRKDFGGPESGMDAPPPRRR